MFRSRRAALVQRLWRSRAAASAEEEEENQGEAGEDQAGAGAPCSPWAALRRSLTTTSTAIANGTTIGGGSSGSPEPEFRVASLAALRRLSEEQLEALCAAAAGRGAVASSCVRLSDGAFGSLAPGVDPLVLLSRVLRWPDVRHTLELRRLGTCAQAGGDSGGACCNPYHFGRLCMHDSPPPPYSRFSQQCTKLQESPEEETVVSTETGGMDSTWFPEVQGESSFVEAQAPWCTLAYWEQRTRVGPLHHARQAIVSIFYELPLPPESSDATGYGRETPGLCLKALPESNSGSLVVRRARVKVGAGLVLSQEADGIWAYNRGDQPAFVHSPTLTAPPGPGGLTARAPISHRLPSGYTAKIFDHNRAQRLLQTFMPAEGESARDLYSVRVSFGKGWGRDYTRQCILDCPCWLELFFYR
uniref:mothers against decapentaplegic homolog 7-like n=1 Tax=Myxine glutinosa TaxID=7769 RepID=UPI00358E54CD